MTSIRNTAAALGASAVLGAATLVGASDAGAVTATVPNMFWRTCTWSCSPFVQSNGPYNGSVISQCNTKNWLGHVTNTYYKWGRC